MAWEEDSITRLEQNLPTYNLTTANDGSISSSSSDDDQYEAFSLSDSRRASDEPISNNNDERQPWWRFGAKEPPASDTICWGDDTITNGSDDDDSSIVERPNKECSNNAMLQLDEAEIRPSTWWQRSFRRGTMERANSESTAGGKSGKDVDGESQQSPQRMPQPQPQQQPDDKDDELNQLLFPRRGRTRRPSQDSTLKGSVFSHDNSQSSKRSALSNNFHSHSSASIGSNRWHSENEEEEDVDQVVRRHSISMNLTSIERALLADIVKPNENRWKKRPDNDKHYKQLSSSIPEEDSHSDDSLREETVETTMETPVSECPRHDLDGEESLSSEGVDEDGLYCTWSVPLDPPQDRHDNNNNNNNIDEKNNNIPHNTSTLPLWDTQATLSLKKSVSLSRTRVIDDVSSIASSEHSGRIVTNPNSNNYHNNGRRRPRSNTRDTSKLSLLSSFRSKSKMSSRAQMVLRDDSSYCREEEEDDLEKEVFAFQDERHANVTKEAMNLMESVNRSVVSMGMEPPFRDMEEICPPFKKLHKNLLRQLKELDAISTPDQEEKLMRASIYTAKHLPQRQHHHQQLLKSKTKGLTGSFTSNTSEITGTSEAPSLDDRKAVAEFIMNRITSHENASISKTSPADAKTHTAYLPNHMYYQFIAADKDSIIKPTSLCSGTGITGGDQYLQPDMLNMFGMFGSYFVGAGHLFQESNDDSDDDDDGKPCRHAFYMEPIHEGESVAGSSAASAALSNADSDDELLPTMPGGQVSVELLESIIEELKRGQMREMPQYVVSPEQKRTALDESDISKPSMDGGNDCEEDRVDQHDVSGVPGIPTLNNSNNMPGKSIVDELKRGQMKEYSYALSPTEKRNGMVPSNGDVVGGTTRENLMGYY